MSPKQFALLIRVIANGFAAVVQAITVSQWWSDPQHYQQMNAISTYFYEESEVDEANAEAKQ